MKDNSRKCAKCNASTTKDSNLVLHRFPKPGKENRHRMTAWAKFCYPEEDWNSVEFQSNLWKSHKMLCSRHFPETAFVTRNLDRQTMHRYAVPSEHSEPSELCALKAEFSIPGPSTSMDIHSETDVIASHIEKPSGSPCNP